MRRRSARAIANGWVNTVESPSGTIAKKRKIQLGAQIYTLFARNGRPFLETGVVRFGELNRVRFDVIDPA